MSYIDLTTAKLHIRVDASNEDTLIQVWIDTAESQVSEFMNRNVYADSTALNAAIADAPAAFTSAAGAYDAAITAAMSIERGPKREAALRYATDALQKAIRDSDYTMRGIVVNSSIKAAALLAIDTFYENRGEDSALPAASRSLARPYRSGMGL